MSNQATAPAPTAVGVETAVPVQFKRFQENYRPGIICDLPEIVDIARQIGREMSAKLEDEDARKRFLVLNEAKKEILGRYEMYQILHAQNPADAEIESKYNDSKTALETLEQKVAQSRSSLLTVFINNVRDHLYKVTYHSSASSSSSSLSANLLSNVALVQSPTLRCQLCGNNDETFFITEYKSGDITCVKCGAIALEHVMFDGDWARNFEGEENTSSIGPKPNPLLSNSANLKTSFSSTQPGVSKAKLKQLRLISDVVELNQSNYSALGIGSASASDGAMNERKTREGYKDKQKLRAFDKFDSVAERLHLSESVVQKAKETFAAFRDNREHVTNFEETLSVCLIAAVEESVYLRKQRELFAFLESQKEKETEESSSHTNPKKRDHDEFDDTSRPSGEKMMKTTDKAVSKSSTQVHSSTKSVDPKVVGKEAAMTKAMEDLKKKKMGILGTSNYMPYGADLAISSSEGGIGSEDYLDFEFGNVSADQTLVASIRKKGFEKFTYAPTPGNGNSENAKGKVVTSSVVNKDDRKNSLVSTLSAIKSATAQTSNDNTTSVQSSEDHVTDAWLDELYTRAGDREVNPEVDEREEYKSPS
jgi:transcription initiation factor TFIIIB Brf1 subunit/transcription initiation factor TFIIB